MSSVGHLRTSPFFVNTYFVCNVNNFGNFLISYVYTSIQMKSVVSSADPISKSVDELFMMGEVIVGSE